MPRMFGRLFGSKIFKKKFGDLIKVGTGGTLVFASVNIYHQNEKFYNTWVMPLLLSLDPETAHTLAVKAAKYHLVPEAKLRESHLLEPPGSSTTTVTVSQESVKV
ncbi:Dihydroorotate dehydrogenase (quinone), mitochondrial [Chionoecetes opilio]|uniref:Dihydroorotate dehydrogenase (Quinone), mitochondrial n=1 Tax=Chionoecetes opilio TaxID=41210 RepID=A0A8J4YDK3_CHIOP|nr:Dihydroorotate dehydrogenase (quinone), mitochondrial [Chionoecetes opilio]